MYTWFFISVLGLIATVPLHFLSVEHLKLQKRYGRKKGNKIGEAIKGVKETTLKVAETHRTEAIVTAGVYSIVRHPQYLGALLAHAGISFLLSAWYSLLLTPLTVVLIYLISKKEEEELRQRI